MLDAHLLLGEAYDGAKATPRRSGLIAVYSTGRHMQRSILGVGAIEGISFGAGHALGIAVHISQFGAARKGLAINILYTLRQHDSGEAAATSESTLSNARHALGDGDVGEADAILESIVSNARHALGEGDGGEAAATPESIVSNARHALGDGDVGEAAAMLVFTTCYYSIFCE